MHVNMWQHDTTLNNPVTFLCGPYFLMAWNIHVLCNLSSAMRGIAMHAIVMH